MKRHADSAHAYRARLCFGGTRTPITAEGGAHVTLSGVPLPAGARSTRPVATLDRRQHVV